MTTYKRGTGAKSYRGRFVAAWVMSMESGVPLRRVQRICLQTIGDDVTAAVDAEAARVKARAEEIARVKHTAALIGVKRNTIYTRRSRKKSAVKLAS